MYSISFFSPNPQGLWLAGPTLIPFAVWHAVVCCTILLGLTARAHRSFEICRLSRCAWAARSHPERDRARMSMMGLEVTFSVPMYERPRPRRSAAQIAYVQPLYDVQGLFSIYLEAPSRFFLSSKLRPLGFPLE